jgi:hypothetical protein
MSMADTAEYQLSSLAEAMTTALREAEKSAEWRNPAYRDGYAAALEEVAESMGLKTITSYHYP